MKPRQTVLILDLIDSALDSKVVAWSEYDGMGERLHMAGDRDEPPYETGLEALLDGRRLFPLSPLPHARGDEPRTSYLRHEFAFEQLVDLSG
jgi:hypothetical protein